MSSAYWLVAGRQSRLAVLAGSRPVAHGGRDGDVPGLSFCAPALGVKLLGAQHFLSFSGYFGSPYHRPHYWLVPSPMFVPKRSQRGVVGSTLSLLLETPPFIGPTCSLFVNYISCDSHIPYFMHLLIGFFVPLSHHPVVPSSLRPDYL